MSDAEIAIFLAVLSCYGRGDGPPAASVEALLTSFPTILPGGIAVTTSNRTIVPGCCCGLENWPEWRNVTATGAVPWTGHDPWPQVQLADSEVHVWSDAANARPADETPIVFPRAAFVTALDRVAADLDEFLGSLRHWLDRHAPAQAQELVDRFQANFVLPRATQS